MAELGQLAKHEADFRKLNVQLLAISVDPPARGLEVKQRLDAGFPILSDEHLAAMHRYGTRSPEYKNQLGISVNTPTLMLVDAQGIIRWIHQASDYRKRLSVADDLAAAREALNSK